MKSKLLQNLAIVVGLALVAELVHGHTNLDEALQSLKFSLFFTTSLWFGNIYAIAKVRDFLPGVGNTGKRIATQFAVGTLLAVTVAIFFENVLTYGAYGYWSDADATLGTVRTCLIMTYSVSAVWEASYYFELWREAEAAAGALQQANLQHQLTRLKAELNPHFLFNNFNTLASVIEEDPPRATRMVEALSRYYRYILKAESTPLTTLEEELESLEAYAFLLRIRYEEAFLLEVDVPGAYLGFRLPALTLQTLAENATKHNAVTTSEPLVLQITCHPDGGLEVRNNRIARHGDAPGAGIGLANLRDRSRLLGLGDISFGPEGDFYTITLPLLPPSSTVSTTTLYEDSAARG